MTNDKNEKVILEITNSRDGFLVIATRILNPKQTVKVPFVNMRQLEDAQTAERNKMIEIHTEITPEIIEKLGGNPEELEEDEGDDTDKETEETDKDKEDEVEPEADKDKETETEPETETDKDKEDEVEPEADKDKEDEVEPETDKDKETETEPEAETDKDKETEEGLTAEDIDGMTIKEMKEFVEENDLVIEDINNLKAAELKEALKKELGLL